MKKILVIMILSLVFQLFADLEYGKYQFNEGLYDEAIIEFEQVIRNSPTSDEAQEAWHYIGKAYLAQERSDRAETAFEKVIEGYPNSSNLDKNLFYLAQVQKTNGKLRLAVSNYKKLIKNYPLSDFTKLALTDYLESFLDQDENQMVILEADKLALNYPQSDHLAEIYLIQAKAYYAENMQKDGDEKIEQIIKEYKNYNAKWQAVQIKIDRMERQSGTALAADEMQKLLSGEIPRLFEENLRLQLVNYYFELDNYDLALQQLELLSEKFNNSPKLDQIITYKNFAKLQLKRYSEISTSFAENKKVFRHSLLAAEYKLIVAEAWLEQNDFKRSNELLLDVLDSAEAEIDLYKAGLLQAELWQKRGKLQASTRAYKKLLDSPLAELDHILMRLGDIYLEEFKNYNLAKKFYQQIVMNSNDNGQVQRAIYKSANCLETMGEFAEAIKELQQIDLDLVQDSFLKDKITTKLNYLQKYRLKDYRNAFNNLLTAMDHYLEDDNKTNFKSEIVTILSEDLKEQTRSLELLEDTNDTLLNYKKAKVLLSLVERAKLESKTSESAEYLLKLQNVLAQISNPVWKSEIDIRLKITQNPKLNKELIAEMKSYIEQNPQSAAANQFRLLGAEYYWGKSADNASEWAEGLILDKHISVEEFARNKMKLAEYYYKFDNDRKALENYQLASTEISLYYPTEYYHFAVVLNKSGQTSEAADKLSFLINNNDSFDDFAEVVDYFAKILRKLDRIEEAIRYQLLIVDNDRNDKFYRQVSADYLSLSDKENAKKMLMYIPEKSEVVLAELAKLQFETADYEMSKYSYEKLIKMNSQELDYYWYLGQINFRNAEYLGAAENYKIIVDKLGTKLGEYPHISQLAKENVVALYRINNRPKAEKLQKQYKNVLSQDDQDEIMLSRGVYYIKNDQKQAKKVFDKMIKQKGLDKDLLIETYFWRGVTNVKLADVALAKNDFTTVANSVNKEFSNQAHLKLGTLNFSEENYQEALNHYYQVIENDDDGKLAFDAAQNFALVCKTIEEWQKAINAYEIILERWGDEGLESKTVFDIAFCHYRDKRYQHAVEMFDRAITILDDEETKAEAQYWIGEAYFGMEQYEKAISELLKVGYNYSQFTQWAASAELRAGEAYVEMNNYPKSKQIYQRVKDKYGAYSQWGTAAQKRIDEMK